MIVFVRLARFNPEAPRQRGHLDDVPFKVCGAATVSGIADIEKCCSEWERQSFVC
jgi:hypothetical protein